jgi:HAD superfamily hydrolase (TIGR01509 family)
MSQGEVWRYFESQYGKPIRPDQRNVWHTWNDLRPLPEMLTLMRKLKSQGYPVGIISNITATAAEDVRRHGGYDEADFAILSCEVGCKKPEPEIYELATRHLPGIKPEEVFYMDDRQHAIEGAKQYGFQTRLVQEHRALIREVEGLIAV